MNRKSVVFITLLVCVVGPMNVHAVTVTVNCSAQGPLSSINSALQFLPITGPNTIRVIGTCRENVAIQGYDRLTLVGIGGATITDASGGTDNVITIDDSRRISLQSLVIDQGLYGVYCAHNSACDFTGNTVQNAAISGVFVSLNSSATFSGDTVQNNGGGIDVKFHSFVQLSAGTVLQYNRANGLTEQGNADARLTGATIRGNLGAGVFIDESSVARFNATGATVPNTITENGSDGVFIRDVSFARFLGANNITGNTGFDIECGDQFAAVRGKANTGGGTTNCP